jgi:dipeptidyl aminopeptidase/acylaminoacyl peptidase
MPIQNVRVTSTVHRRLRLLTLLTMAVPAALAGRGAAPGARVTVADLMAVRSIVDVKISPDGSRVAYAVSTPSVAKNAHETAVFVVPAAGGSPVRVAADVQIYTPALPAPRLRWLPDGASVSVLGLVGGRAQVFTAAAAGGGEARAVTTAPRGVVTYEWSPDGTRLAFITRDAPVPSPVTRAGTPDPATRLWVQAAGGAAQPLTPDGQYVDSLSWSPGGDTIAYSASSTTGFMAPYATRIYIVPAGGGAPRPLVDRAGMNTSPQFSPDGRAIAFVTTDTKVGLLAPRGLGVAAVADGALRAYELGGAWIGELQWARDSQSIFVLMNEGTFATGAQMFEMPVVRVPLGGAAAARVVDGPTVNYSLSVSRDGRRIAYRAVEGRTVGDVYVQDLASGARTRLTRVNPQLDEHALGRLEAISWTSFDGMQIWGLLLTPPEWDGKRRLATIVYCHGGPIGGVTYGLFPQFAHTVGQVDPYATEAFASAGYAVLFPMPRGGSGYGEAGHRAIVDAWGEADYKDIMAGVDALVDRGVADPGRLGVMGASYGGFMTNWIMTQTGRFKAAASAASISDLNDMYYLSDSAEVMAEYFKRPWENRASYAAHSPLTFADRVTTPLLIQHGERDVRVPVANAQKFYRALKALGKTVEYDVYPTGGHVYYEPAQQRATMERSLEWFLRWVVP